jgi:hypothetical protein
VGLVGITGIDREARHAVGAKPPRGGGTRLRQREETLEPQGPLQNLGTHPDGVQTAPAQLAGGERKVSGDGLDVDGVPGHQRVHGSTHQRIDVRRAPELQQEMGLEDLQCPLRRLGHGERLHDAFDRPAPQLRQHRPLVDKVVKHRRQWRRGSRVEPHPHNGGARRDDLHFVPGQRPKQVRPTADREVELDSTGRQVPLHVGRVTGALDPDRAHHPRQRRQRQLLDIGVHGQHRDTRTRAEERNRT